MIIPSEPSQAIRTISIHKDYVKIHPLIVDATPIKYNSFLPDRTGNNSVNSTFMQQENLNETRNPTQQDIQNSSHFVKEQISETIATTTQQSISLIHPNLTTPRPRNPMKPQITLESTVKPSVVPKYTQMDYQAFTPIAKLTQKKHPSEIIFQNIITTM